MAQPNLLDIIPEQLFQSYSIADIDQVQKKLQYEIERKREELRAMVGERYRDLIQAADTIEEMKETTGSTLNHINEMMVACKSLHHSHLLGFKIDERPVKSSQLTQDPVRSISIQVKLLIEIPEKMWKSIDNDDFVTASRLFIMAMHVHTGLQLQLGSKNVLPGLKPLRRIAEQYWNSIVNINYKLINICTDKLKTVDISNEMAVSCLVALYISDPQTMVQLLTTLITRSSHSGLESTLHFDLAKILEGDVKAQIKMKIVNAVKIVLKTVKFVHACFVENGGGAVLEMLRNLHGNESQPLIELVQFGEASALKFLPAVVANYRLPPKKELQPINIESLTHSIQIWSKRDKAFIETTVAALLQNVTRVKVLHEIREEAFRLETPSNWSEICKSLNMPEILVWTHYFQPILTSRVKVIIDNRWEKVYDTFKTQILIDLTKSSDNEMREADINWFVWKDLIGETIIESRSEVVNVMTALMKGMGRQDRGCTPNLEKLCESLDLELQKMLEDLKDYLYQGRKSEKEKLIFVYDDENDIENMHSDRREIEQYLRDTSDKYIQSMLQYIKACFEEPTLQATDLQKKITTIYTARFTQAILILVPNLRNCYIPDDNLVLNDENALRAWSNVCATLKESCQFCWSKWIDIAMDRVLDLTKCLPQEFTLEANVDYIMMQWDVIKIEEKDDEGKSIESTIKVPAGPSLKLQEYLYSVSRILDEVVPHTLPHEIHALFIDKITSITFAHYNKVIREKEADINQRCALQLLMDVRHSTLLLVPRENKKVIEFSQDICEFLRQQIDPFDYDVFYPYIQTNLKRSVQRVQTLLGSLILHHGQLIGITGTKPVLSGGTADKAANILASVDSHWFSILPVATPANLHKKQDKPTKKKVTSSPNKSRSDISELMTSSLPINFANARSGAASFFNSMTSDWFSG